MTIHESGLFRNLLVHALVTSAILLSICHIGKPIEQSGIIFGTWLYNLMSAFMTSFQLLESMKKLFGNNSTSLIQLKRKKLNLEKERKKVITEYNNALEKIKKLDHQIAELEHQINGH